MYKTSKDIVVGDVIVWNTDEGIAYGEVFEIVGKTTMENEHGEYEVVVLRGVFNCKEGSSLVYDMPDYADILIFRE